MEFYLVKNHKIANNLTAPEAKEKINTNLESLLFKKCVVFKKKKQSNFTSQK
jgi:hypothetical protein